MTIKGCSDKDKNKNNQENQELQTEKSDNPYENEVTSPKKNKIGSNDSAIANAALRNKGISEANNYGHDDENGNYLSNIGDHILFRFEILCELGRGSFGHVNKPT